MPSRRTISRPRRAAAVSWPNTPTFSKRDRIGSAGRPGAVHDQRELRQRSLKSQVREEMIAREQREGAARAPDRWRSETRPELRPDLRANTAAQADTSSEESPDLARIRASIRGRDARYARARLRLPAPPARIRGEVLAVREISRRPAPGCPFTVKYRTGLTRTPGGAPIRQF